MPMMKNINFPANTLMFIEFIVETVNFDLYETDELDDYLYYLP